MRRYPNCLFLSRRRSLTTAANKVAFQLWQSGNSCFKKWPCRRPATWINRIRFLDTQMRLNCNGRLYHLNRLVQLSYPDVCQSTSQSLFAGGLSMSSEPVVTVHPSNVPNLSALLLAPPSIDSLGRSE